MGWWWASKTRCPLVQLVLLCISIFPRRVIDPYKGIQDNLGFWIPRRGFRITGTGFQIPWAVFPIPKPRILDFTSTLGESKFESLYVYGKLPTSPSLKLTICPKWRVSVDVGFVWGEGGGRGEGTNTPEPFYFSQRESLSFRTTSPVK